MDAPPTPRPSALLLDVGGTLLQEDGYDLSAGVRALAPRGGAAELAGELQAAVDRVHATNAAELTVARWLEENRERFAREGSIEALEWELWRATARLTRIPGARAALERLAGAGLALGCVSNAVFSGSVLRRELERHGLAEGLRFVLSSADRGVRKPAPALFEAALALLGSPAEATWFVGDSWSADVEGAAAAGLFPVWFTAQGEAPSAIAHARAGDWRQVYIRVKAALEG